MTSHLSAVPDLADAKSPVAPLDAYVPDVSLDLEDDGLRELRQSIDADPAAKAAFLDATRRTSFLGRLRKVRKAAGLKQADFAQILGTTQSAVSQMESGRTDPHLRTLQRFARAGGRRLDFAVVPDTVPVYDESMAKNLWQWVELNVLSKLLTTIAMRPQQERTLSELARLVRLPEALVGPILDSLEDRRWVRIEQDESSAISVYTVGDIDAYVIGVSVEHSRVTAVLLNLHGEVRPDSEIAHVHSRSERSVITAIASVAKTLYDKCGKDGILGVGVSLAGIVSAYEGTVEYAPELDNGTDNWRGVRLEKLVEKRLQSDLKDHRLRVAVENDANALAIREYMTRRSQSVFVVLLSGTGIGTGFATQGHVIYGVNSAAGESGHTIVHPTSSRPCRAGLGHSGCLETVASARAITQEILGEDGNPSDLAARLRSASTVANGNSGEALHARSVFEGAGAELGSFIATATTLLDPAEVVVFAHPELTDIGLTSSSIYRSAVMESFEKAGTGVFQRPKIQWRTLGESTNSAAAAAAGMRHFLQNPVRWQPAVASPSPAGTDSEPYHNDADVAVTELQFAAIQWPASVDGSWARESFVEKDPKRSRDLVAP